MRSVSAREAEESKKRMLAWAASEKSSTSLRLGDWIFGRNQPVVEEPQPELVASKTPGAVQRNWQVPAEFPLCPATNDPSPIETYLGRMNKGEVAVISPWGETKIGEAALSSDGRAIFLLGEHGKDAIKPWSLSKITFETGQFVDESQGTFFMRDGAEKEFTLAQGLLWEGGETFDDYC